MSVLRKNKKKSNPDFFKHAKKTMGTKRFSAAVKKGTKKASELRLKMVREKLGLTQGDLEGLTQPEVSKIEGRKDLKISTLDKYARSMGMKIRIVLTSEEDEDIRPICIYG